MRQWLTLSALLLAMSVAAASAQEWVGFAGVSDTMGAQAGRLCLGEGDATETGIGCPAYAPSVTTSGDVSVSGNISANKFIGDGSELTGVTGAAADRIISGTNAGTSMIAISNTGFISITQNNTDTGWFDPTRGLVTLGVSATGPISGSNGYFSGRMAIGTAPTASMPRMVIQGDSTSVADAGYSSYGDFRYQLIVGANNVTGSPGDLNAIVMGSGPGNHNPAIRMNNTASQRGYVGFIDINNYGISTKNNGPHAMNLVLRTEGVTRVHVSSTGEVGIGGPGFPSVAMRVSGTVSATDAIQVGSSAIACSAGIPGAIRYEAGNIEYCNGTSWAALSTGGGGATDRIVSGSALAWISPTGTVFMRGRLDLVTGTGVVAIGPTAATGNAGQFVTAVGDRAAQDTATESTAIGALAGQANTGAGAVLAGFMTGWGNVGTHAVLIGTQAGFNNRGDRVAALGYRAGNGVSGQATSHDSVFIGPYSGYSVTNAERNAFLGAQSGVSVTSGDENILIGYRAATNLTTGSSNTIIGSGVHAQSATGSGQLSIGNAIFGLNVSGTGTTVAGDARIGIKTAVPQTELEVDGTISATNIRAANIITATYFEGDGSRLTGLSGGGGPTDRIVSGSAMTYINPTGSIRVRGILDIVTGTNVVAVGAGAAANSTGNSGMTALGANAAASSTGSVYVVAIGQEAGQNNSGAHGLIAIGTLAGYNNNGGIGAITIGSYSGTENRGLYPVIIGEQAGSYNRGSRNVMIGYGSGIGVNGQATSHDSVFLGSYSGRYVTNAERNAFLGAHSGLYVSSGDENTLLGYRAGINVTSGSSNTVIGVAAGVADPSGSGQLSIGNAIYGVNVSGTGNTVAAHARIGIGTQSPTAHFEVVGTISATNFVGDGSGLTNLPGGGGVSDRIVSGTGNRTRIVAVSDTGYISITQNNTNTAWFDPTRGLVTLGVSATGSISGSTGYFHGNVGIGTATPLAKLDVAGHAVISNATSRTLSFGNVGYAYPGAGSAGMKVQLYGNLPNVMSTDDYALGVAGGELWLNSPGRISWYINAAERMTLAIDGAVGIANSGPIAKLDVAGTISASDAIQVGGSSLTCTMGIPGAIRYNSGNIEYCNGTSWTSLSGGGGGGSPDRIVSGTGNRTRIVAVSNTGFISITQNNGDTGWFDPTRGLVTLGVSATGSISGTNGYFSGNVGIGTSTPAELLHVAGGTLRVADSVTPHIRVMTNSNAGGWAGQTFIGGANTLNGLVAGQFFHNFDSSWVSSDVASIEVRRGAAAHQGELTFLTNGGTGNIERLRIKEDGRIGINAFVPEAQLHIRPPNGVVGLKITNEGNGRGLAQIGTTMHLQSHTESENDWSGGLLGNGVFYDHANHVYDLSTNAEWHRAAIEFMNSGVIAFYSESADRTGNTALTPSEWQKLERMRITADTVDVSGSLRIWNGASASGYEHLRFQTTDYGTDKPALVVKPDSGGIWRLQMYDGQVTGTLVLETRRVKIGTGTASEKLDVAGNVQADAYLYSSDKRLKTDIKPLSGDLVKFDAIQPVTFRFISETSPRERLGVLAQEVEQAYPQAVYTGPDGFKKVDYPALVPALISGVKELRDENRALRAANDFLQQEMKAANDNFEQRIRALEGRKASMK